MKRMVEITVMGKQLNLDGIEWGKLKEIFQGIPIIDDRDEIGHEGDNLGKMWNWEKQLPRKNGWTTLHSMVSIQVYYDTRKDMFADDFKETYKRFKDSIKEAKDNFDNYKSDPKRSYNCIYPPIMATLSNYGMSIWFDDSVDKQKHDN
jgi:hypothetical protein